MLKVTKEGQVLEPTTLSFENHGVFNPAVIDMDGQTHLFYRATNKANFSTIGRCLLPEPTRTTQRTDTPILVPTETYEAHGMEDPRIVRLDDQFLMTYTAYDGQHALGALLTSSDLITFHHEGVLTPQLTYKEFSLCMECFRDINPKYMRFVRLFNKRVGAQSIENMILWDKDVVFFPKRINGKMAMLHRIYPDIQVAYFQHWTELTYAFWKEYLFHIKEHIVLSGKYHFEDSYVGAGCPPIETPYGWLLIYHGVNDTAFGYVYSTGAALLETNDPTKEIGRLPYPLFEPDQDWEMKGVTANVVFPTGHQILGDRLYIYYGAADKRVAVASVSIQDLTHEILQYAFTKTTSGK
jgi:predicted GH43/DUF377 family glycosyl hydrolase